MADSTTVAATTAAPASVDLLLEPWLVVVIIVIIDFVIQWICFPIAYGLKTEKFYDMAGSLTHLTVVWVAFGLLASYRHIRCIVQSVCVSVWAVRLGIFLVYRAAKYGDKRFEEIRKSCVRFFITWTLQAVWVGCNLAPTIASLTASATLATPGSLECATYLGWSLFLIGILTETVSDIQKSIFKAKPGEQWPIYSVGLWSISRHPNYFGRNSTMVGPGWLSLHRLVSTILTNGGSGSPLLARCSYSASSASLLVCEWYSLLEKSAYKRWGEDPEYQDLLEEYTCTCCH
uniref:S5A_REDUCTASE domain-containing protein n=1 Tax=Macrostomum lignano TaxID=282301 RepID=A0A1I8FED2_9PLAT